MKELSLCCVWPRGWSGFKRFLQQGQIQLLPNEQAVLQLEIMVNIWCKVSWKILASGQSFSLKVKQLSFHFWPRDWSNFLRFLLEFYLCPNCFYPLSIKWNWCSVCLTENILRSNSSIIHILFRSHHHWSFLEKSFCFSTRFLLFKCFLEVVIVAFLRVYLIGNIADPLRMSIESTFGIWNTEPILLNFQTFRKCHRRYISQQG